MRGLWNLNVAIAVCAAGLIYCSIVLLSSEDVVAVMFGILYGVIGLGCVADLVLKYAKRR